jgi:hypothetical protein
VIWYDIWYDITRDIWYIWYIWYDNIYMIWYDIWYDMIYLLTAIGSPSGVSSTVHIYTERHKKMYRKTKSAYFNKRHIWGRQFVAVANTKINKELHGVQNRQLSLHCYKTQFHIFTSDSLPLRILGSLFWNSSRTWNG